ncbi:MAG: Asp23/Gls24 family envelope stress response protein [Anaerolineae bacterium]|nr:Asp23/Gls24 family envelope stress response protein [Anaerolineae bacterium]
MEKGERLGKIEITPEALIEFISLTALECYGIVGLVRKTPWSGSYLHPGVEISWAGPELIVNLYVIMEYGVRITEVAHNLKERVKYAVEKNLGIPVAQVNVYVQDLRIDI